MFICVFYTVANNIIPSIVTVPNKTVYDVGNSVTLSCSVIYPQSSFIDVNTVVNIEWSNGSTLVSYTAINDYTLQYTLSGLKLSDAGEYTCYSFVSTEQYHPYILNSNLTSQSIQLLIQGI